MKSSWNVISYSEIYEEKKDLKSVTLVSDTKLSKRNISFEKKSKKSEKLKKLLKPKAGCEIMKVKYQMKFMLLYKLDEKR